MSMTSGCSDEKLLCFIAFSTRSCNTAGGRKPLHCLTPGLTFAMTPSSWRTFIKYKYESRNLISSATGIRFRSKLVMMYRYTFDRLLRNFPASPLSSSISSSRLLKLLNMKCGLICSFRELSCDCKVSIIPSPWANALP